MQLHPEAFDLSAASDRTQKHTMLSLDTLAARMRMARGHTRASIDDIRNAETEHICMTCGRCRRMCFLSTVMLKPDANTWLSHQSYSSRYDLEEMDESRLCCLDCALAREHDLQGNMEFLVTRYSDQDLQLVLKHISDKVASLPPVPVEEFYGLL